MKRIQRALREIRKGSAPRFHGKMRKRDVQEILAIHVAYAPRHVRQTTPFVGRDDIGE